MLTTDRIGTCTRHHANLQVCIQSVCIGSVCYARSHLTTLHIVFLFLFTHSSPEAVWKDWGCKRPISYVRPSGLSQLLCRSRKLGHLTPTLLPASVWGQGYKLDLTRPSAVTAAPAAQRPAPARRLRGADFG